VFGTGVTDDEMWTGYLKRTLARTRGLKPRNVCIQNFSQVGASNRYICRVMLEQCNRVRPDLAIVCFTHADRGEHYSHGAPRNVGPWKIPTEIDSLEQLNEAAWHYMFYENGVGNFETLKEMLLLHAMFERKGIAYLFIWVEHSILSGQEISSCEGLQDLANLANQVHLQNFSILSPHIFVDKSAGHPGPDSHRLFGERVAAVSRFYLSFPKSSHAAQLGGGHRGEGRIGVLRHVEFAKRYFASTLLMGSWGSNNAPRIRNRMWNAKFQEEREQSLDYVIRELPSVEARQFKHIVVMDSAPHIQEICYRNNFMEFNLRNATGLPRPIELIVGSYVRYYNGETLLARHLVNMLCVLSISSILGYPLILGSTLPLESIHKNRYFSPFLDLLRDFMVAPGVFANDASSRTGIVSMCKFMSASALEAGFVDLREFLPQELGALDDADALRKRLQDNMLINKIDARRNNYSLN
jgi:hypothetical protein